MSSTVTTSTVVTLTAAASFGDLAAMLTIIALVLFGSTLLAREISSSARGVLGRQAAHGLDIALMPLLSIFGLVIALNAQTFAGA